MLLLISRINPVFIQEVTVLDERRLFKKLQDQSFKNCKNWMLVYKELRGNLGHCSCPNFNIINRRLKYPHLFIKWVVQVYIYLWSLAFSLYLLTLLKCSHHQQWFKQMHILKIVLIIWQSRSRFMECMAVNVR